MRDDIGGIAYDLDGTFYPNYRLNRALIPFFLKEWPFLLAFGRARSIIRAAQERGVPGPELPPLPDAAPNSGPDFYDVQARLAARILRADPAAVKKKAAILIYRGWEPHFRKITLFPGVAETLAAIRAAGCRQGLLSDFPPERKLEYLGLRDCWDAILCSERTGRLKPDPLPFQKMAEALGLPPERILYVGNSRRYDMAGAKRAGMKTALISFFPFFQGRSRGSADFIFHDYRQLLKYVVT
ncbi:MAG: HAD family hydrolase [Treponema sp.]|jgi:putative hydrolase of the HAD superfamily|nr:HAD family hydrolase [Treponema sp.]